MLVPRRDLDPLTRARMLRDGALRPAGLAHLRPGDLPLDRAARAACVAAVVPAHTTLSGLVGAWVHTGLAAALVARVVLVGARGLHRVVADPGSPWRPEFHSGLAAADPSETLAGLRLAPLPRCLADSLRWDDGPRAINVATAVCASQPGLVADVAQAVSRASSKGRGADRESARWAAVRARLAARSARGDARP